MKTIFTLLLILVGQVHAANCFKEKCEFSPTDLATAQELSLKIYDVEFLNVMLFDYDDKILKVSYSVNGVVKEKLLHVTERRIWDREQTLKGELLLDKVVSEDGSGCDAYDAVLATLSFTITKDGSNIGFDELSLEVERHENWDVCHGSTDITPISYTITK